MEGWYEIYEICYTIFCVSGSPLLLPHLLCLVPHPCNSPKYPTQQLSISRNLQKYLVHALKKYHPLRPPPPPFVIATKKLLTAHSQLFAIHKTTTTRVRRKKTRKYSLLLLLLLRTVIFWLCSLLLLPPHPPKKPCSHIPAKNIFEKREFIGQSPSFKFPQRFSAKNPPSLHPLLKRKNKGSL